jgi:ABC-type sugar transport system ATPase subunit
MLRMIARLEDTSEGSLHIGDRLVNDIDPADRDIGYG